MKQPFAQLMGVVVLLIIISPLSAVFCRTVDGHQLCILEIQRSAKNHWEYRAIVRIDGQTQPKQVYDCQDRVRIQPNGEIFAFQRLDGGDLICSFFRR